MSPLITPEVGESTSNHSVHVHLGWQWVVPWLLVAVVMVTGSVCILGVLVDSSSMTVVRLVGGSFEKTVPAVPVSILVQMPVEEVGFVVKAGVDGWNVLGMMVSVVWIEETVPGLLLSMTLETCGVLLVEDVTIVAV